MQYSNKAVASTEAMDTHQKALSVNLDPRRYGTFAEIGAGQEVVRWFFRVGGGAGTIAKSMSAYDMKVSDAINGRASRYVCRERLQAMLDYEHKLNLDRLREVRGDTTAFFAFADTVSARNFRGTNECHGWMGIKFQAHPRDDDSQIINVSDVIGCPGAHPILGECGTAPLTLKTGTLGWVSAGVILGDSPTVKYAALKP